VIGVIGILYTTYGCVPARTRPLYLQAREKNPSRWSGDTRNWSPIGADTLNPERDCVIKAHTGYDDIQRMAA